MTDQEIFDELSAPFPSDSIEWRVGSMTKDGSKGMALAYITARAVMDRFDTACGPGRWQSEHVHLGGERMGCRIGVVMGNGWVWESGGAGETDFEGEKGAFSSALKRAAVSWGVGRYLYELPAPWVAVENKRIVEGELKKLAGIHDEFANKAGWGARPGVQAYRLLKKVAEEFVTDAAAAQEFKDKNAAEIALLPVAMRRHLFTVLDHIGSNAREAA